MLRKASIQLLRNLRQRGGHGWPGGSFWSEGTQTGRNGYLFGETPPPPGHQRKWESWELITYVGYGTAAVLGIMIVNGPDKSLQTWAKPVALKELDEEDEIFTKYATDAAVQARATATLKEHGKHPDRYYDAIMMRNEYDILKAKALGSS